MKAVVSKPLPTVAVSGTRPDGFTVAINDVSCVGMLNPVVVVLTLIVEVPWPAPTKLVVALAWPPVKVSGEELIVPALVLLLVTLTVAVTAPLRGNVCTKFKEESSCAGYTESGVCIPGFVVNVAVPIPAGPAMINPDGVNCTVPVPDVKPVPLAVTVTCPDATKP